MLSDILSNLSDIRCRLTQCLQSLPGLPADALQTWNKIEMLVAAEQRQGVLPRQSRNPEIIPRSGGARCLSVRCELRRTIPQSLCPRQVPGNSRAPPRASVHTASDGATAGYRICTRRRQSPELQCRMLVSEAAPGWIWPSAMADSPFVSRITSTPEVRSSQTPHR